MKLLVIKHDCPKLYLYTSVIFHNFTPAKAFS